MRLTLLDGTAPQPLALDLQHAVAGIDVPPDPHLVAASSPLQVSTVGEQVGGVEVDRRVAEQPTLVDLEGAPLVAEGVDQSFEGLQPYYVLAVDTGQQRGPGIEGRQIDRGQTTDHRRDLFGGRRERGQGPGVLTRDRRHTITSFRSRS